MESLSVRVARWIALQEIILIPPTQMPTTYRSQLHPLGDRQWHLQEPLGG